MTTGRPAARASAAATQNVSDRLGSRNTSAAAEALAAGRPVVMGALGGQGDFVHPGNGRLVAERTPEAFGGAVLDVVADPGLLGPEAMAAEIRSVYGSERIGADLDRLYRSVLAGRHGRRRL